MQTIPSTETIALPPIIPGSVHHWPEPAIQGLDLQQVFLLSSFSFFCDDRAEGATSAQREGEKRRRKERLVILRRPEIEQQWHSIVMDEILSAAFVLYAKIAANQIQGKQKECQSTSVCITWLPCETEVKHFDLIALL